MNDLLKNPLVLVAAAALAFVAVSAMRREDERADEAPGAPPIPQGKESASRLADEAAGAALGHELQAAGLLAPELDKDTVDRKPRQVVVGDPRGGDRDEAVIHALHAHAALWPATHDYFWETLSWTGAGFEYKDERGVQAFVCVEHPRGVFHAAQLFRTKEIAERPFVVAYWAEPGLTGLVRTGGGLLSALRPGTVARMHSSTDLLVRAKNPNDRSGHSLAGWSGFFDRDAPAWPVGAGHPAPSWQGGRYLASPGAAHYQRVMARGLVPRTGSEGASSLQWAMTQGTRGPCPVLSHWLTPMPFIIPDHYHASSEWDPARERWLARRHPLTKDAWRCYSFARWKRIPENPDWSVVWWTPWYPQSRADANNQPSALPATYEPHLGGGSEFSAAFKQWVIDLRQTGDPPRGQWVGAIPIGLPQDCQPDADLVRCTDGCATVGEGDLWTIGDCPPRVSLDAAAWIRERGLTAVPF